MARSRAALLGGLAASAVLAAANALLGYDVSVGLSVWPVAVIGIGIVVVRPSLGLYAAILCIPLESATLPVGGGQLTPAKGLLLLTAILLAVRWARNGAPGRPHAAHLALGLMIALALAGVIVARDSGQALKICLAAVAYAVISVHVAAQGRGEVERILRCVVISAGVVGAVAALTTSTQQLIGDIATNRAQAGFAQPNIFGVYLLLSIPVGLALSFSGPAKWRWAMRMCTLAALAGLGLSLSRASIIGTVVALAVLAAWPVLRRGLIVLMLMAVSTLVFAPSLFTSYPRIAVISQRLSTLTSGTGSAGGDRGALRATTPRMIGDHALLGVGEGNFPNYSLDYNLYDVYGLPFDHPHNLFLTVGAELGVGGLVLLLSLLIAIAASSVRAAEPDRLGRRDPLALALAGVFLGLLVESQGDYPVRTDVVFAVLLIEVGALIALERQRRPMGAGRPVRATASQLGARELPA